MKKKIILTLTMIALLLALAPAASAQDEQAELSISLRRDFGYGGFGNDIQGTFTIRASGPDDLAEVQFYLDDVVIAVDQESPFAFQFNTGNYDPGLHTISAVGILADGSEIRSRELTQDFLSDDDAMGKTIGLVGPILAISALAMVLGAIVPALMGKKGSNRPIGEYSAAGGTVCPRCQFPFSRNVLSPNVVYGKLERCPHCGKWSIRPRASHPELAAAEERLRAAQEETGQIKVDEQDNLKRALDDSRFED
jgi:hypothetical protein